MDQHPFSLQLSFKLLLQASYSNFIIVIFMCVVLPGTAKNEPCLAGKS